jgi:DUF1016 N-terminal domain
MELTTNAQYSQLLAKIDATASRGRAQAMQAVNRELLATYWQIGQHIVEFEQAGQVRAEYGKALIAQLARDLSLRHGKGFSRSNLIRIRQFYLCYQKGATLSHQLSWSHFVELLKIEDPLERGFYEKQAIAALALRNHITKEGRNFRPNLIHQHTFIRAAAQVMQGNDLVRTGSQYWRA